MFLKILNLNKNGTMDYKGLDMNMFIPGRQFYSNDYNACILETKENIQINNADLKQLTNSEYAAEKSVLEGQKNNPIPLEDRITSVEIALANILGM